MSQANGKPTGRDFVASIENRRIDALAGDKDAIEFFRKRDLTVEDLRDWNKTILKCCSACRGVGEGPAFDSRTGVPVDPSGSDR